MSHRVKKPVVKEWPEYEEPEEISSEVSKIDTRPLMPNFDENSDIIMTGKILYRYGVDQVELEGFWSMSSDSLSQEKFSYLFLKKNEKLQYIFHPNEIHPSDSQESALPQNYIVNVCSANLCEAILIPHSGIFSTVISYLTGEYHGFFMYYDKTIEDRFFINFLHDDSQVRLTGIFKYLK